MECKTLRVNIRRVDYNFGSSLNKARGTKVNELDIGGSINGLNLDIGEQRPSEYPFNQVQETPSGHVIELDDTPWRRTCSY